jgi:hypothetical protein
MKLVSKIAAAAALVAIGAVANAAPVTIDNFNAGSITVTSGTSPAAQAGLGANTLGGDRTTNVANVGSTIKVDVAPFNGNLTFSNDVGIQGTATLEYTSTGTDLLQGGLNNGITLVVLEADHPGTIGLTINGVTVVKNVTPSLVSYDLNYFFSEFGVVDFSAVTTAKISLAAGNDRGADWAIDLFEARNIPEPTALGLLAPAALMLGRRRK